MNKVLRSFSLVVGIPTLVAAIYFAFVASDRYVSETRFAIRASKVDSGSGLAGILSSTGISSGGQDTQVVVDYIRSQDMLATLDEQLNLSKHFTDNNIDFVSRLKASPSREELLEHFVDHIEIIENSGADIIVLRTKAYAPEFAKQIAQNIIQLSERLVNELSSRIENDALETAKGEVELAAAKVHEASQALTRFRGVHASLNPAEESSALMGLLAGLETKLSEAKTLLFEKRAFMKDSSSLVKSLKHKVAALQRQLDSERKRVADESGNGMNELINDYQPLALQQELAQQQYTSALTSLELARIEAQRKKRYLSIFVTPALADEATEPQRLMKTMTAFVYSFLIFSIGGLLWSALRDHVGR